MKLLILCLGLALFRSSDAQKIGNKIDVKVMAKEIASKFDPLQVPEVPFNIQFLKSCVISGKFSNFKMTGISKFSMDKVTIDPETQLLSYTLLYPEVVFHGEFQLSVVGCLGKLGNINIQTSVEAQPIDLKVTGETAFKKSSGKYQVGPSEIDIDFDHLSLDIESNDQYVVMLSPFISKVAENFGKLAFQYIFKPTITSIAVSLAKQEANAYLRNQ